jgi:hypothetical protein
MPKVKTDSRICFALEWYDDKQEAMDRSEKVRASGDTYNGGHRHGELCGRSPEFDHVDEETGKQLYAVTTA